MVENTDPELTTRFVDLISRSERILIFTGAGVSTPSGIPDFRGPRGLWKKRKPVYFQDFRLSEDARVEYWEQKLEIYEAFCNAEPNSVHEACVALEQEGKVVAVVTQNVDGLHTKAGTSRGCLVEIHGTNTEIECITCGNRYEPALYFTAFADTHVPPRCGCGGLVKTATISFGQNLHEEDMGRAVSAAEEADLVIALGSTLSVYPAASIPLDAAMRGVPYVIVNQGETDHDGRECLTFRFEDEVEKIFPEAVCEALQRRESTLR
ncbi:MAG: Sir2 family NAD-dependent protein deacetylase [Candidatus Latescibacterota bacterium]|nr:Sir2 family NAD-dependent protein deacetylase [Candidatus Latescibacterota bacterium]